MRIVISGALVSACFVAAAAACGDSEPDESERTIQTIERICDDWRAQLDQRGDFPLADFDPENPSADDLRIVGAYFGSGEGAAQEAIEKLRAVSSPAEIADDVNALIAALEYQGEAARAQSFAARAGDVAGFKATLGESSATMEGVKTASDDLGASACSF